MIVKVIREPDKWTVTVADVPVPASTAHS